MQLRRHQRSDSELIGHQSTVSDAGAADLSNQIHQNRCLATAHVFGGSSRTSDWRVTREYRSYKSLEAALRRWTSSLQVVVQALFRFLVGRDTNILRNPYGIQGNIPVYGSCSLCSVSRPLKAESKFVQASGRANRKAADVTNSTEAPRM